MNSPAPHESETLQVWPDYTGGSLANLPARLLDMLGVEAVGLLPPVREAALPTSFTQNVERVVLVLADGLGQHQLDTAVSEETAPNLGRIVGSTVVGATTHHATLTSVFPSSTIPALTSLATGQPPGDHGLLGWTIHLKELGGPTEIATWRPANRVGTYRDPSWGTPSEASVLHRPSIHRTLSGAGIRTHAVGPGHFTGEPFTNMLYGGSTYEPYTTVEEAVATMDELLGADIGSQRQILHLYLPMVDSVSHVHGPNSTEHREAIGGVDALIGELMSILEGVPSSLLLVTADHGHIETNPDHIVDLNGLGWLVEDLAVCPTGERRFVYLHPIAGRQETLLKKVRTHLGDVCEAFCVEDLLDRGLFGPAPASRIARERAGGVLLLAKGDHQLVFAHSPVDPAPRLRGDHGGTSADEMFVPLLAARF